MRVALEKKYRPYLRKTLKCPVNAEKALWKNISLGLKRLAKTPVSKFKVFFFIMVGGIN